MIDINSHILAGLDDGAKHMQDSIKIAEQAAMQGVEQLIATPTHMDGKYNNPRSDILLHVQDLNQQLAILGLPITVTAGQQIRLHQELLKHIKHGSIVTLNETTDYLLIDLPLNHIPSYTTQLVYDLQLNGFQPIFSDVEKKPAIVRQIDFLYELVKSGSLLQVSATSIVGINGKKTQKLANTLIEHNLVHFIASSVTNSKEYCLKDAIKTIHHKYGSEQANKLMKNALNLINGKPIILDEPIRPAKKKVLGVF